MAVAVDGTSPARATGSAGSDAVTASFTAPTDAFLVACVSMDGGGSPDTFAYTVSDSGGLTWTRRVERTWDETTQGGESAIYTARTTSATARTVTVHQTSGAISVKTVKVYVLTGVDVDGTPLDTPGANNEGGSTTDSISTSSVTPGADGLLVVVDTEFKAKGAETSSDLTEESSTSAGAISYMSGYKTCTSGVGVTGNIDGNGSTGPWQHKWCQITVRQLPATGTGSETIFRPPYQRRDSGNISY